MTTVINGSSPSITFSDSTTQTTAFTTTPTINTITSAASTALTIQSAGTTAITVDTSQNVGIGVVPSAWGSVYSKAIQISTQGAYIAGNTSTYSGGTYAWFGNNGYLDSSAVFRYTASTSACQYSQIANQHIWSYAASGTAGNAITFSEAMRIDSSGNLLKGTTSVYSTAYGTGDISFYSANAGFVTLAPGAAGGGVPTIQIYLNAAGTAVGYIAVSTAATFFTSLSDYRVKKDIITMQGGLEKINKLKPVTYKLKADDSDGEGFIAHELQEIIPFAVIGKKDDVADNGEIKPQAIDQSKIVATLVLAVQELSAEVQSLKQQLGK